MYKNRKTMIEIQLRQQRYHSGYYLNEENFIFLRMGRNKIFMGALTIKVIMNLRLIILAFSNTLDHAVSERRDKDRADQKFCKLTVENAPRAIFGISLTHSQKDLTEEV